jgi:hypothetical protein
MKYIKLGLMWVALVVVASLFGEYVISRELNGFIQLLSFLGMFGLAMYVGGETIKQLTINKEEEKND